MKSKIALVVIILVYLFSFKEYANYKSFLQGGGDSWGYYSYLPATFVYHDLKTIEGTLARRAKYNEGSVRRLENGSIQIEEAHKYGDNTVIKYTCGVAILNLPFFLIAHTFCKLTHLFPADGYSLPYNLLIALGTLFYGILGLWFVRKLLLKYFSDNITTIVLIGLALGTNLYYFSVSGGIGMSHAYLFALYAICLLAIDKFYDTQQKRYAVFIGLATGFITLIRPNEIIILFFPLLWNVVSPSGLKKRVRFIGENFYLFATMATVFLISVSPQVVYWLALTGKPVFYSYTGEKFDFLHPHIKDGLLGYKNGWLTYTPIMYVSVAGLLFLPKYFKKAALAIYTFLPIHVYVIYSWWCWNYINGYGSRPMVETYAILALPFASFLSFIRNQKIIFKILAGIFLVFCIFLNLFQTWQFKKGLIWTEDSNYAFYKTMLFRTQMNDETLVVYDSGQKQPDTSVIQFVKILGALSFEDSTSQAFVTDVKQSGEFAFKMGNGFTPAIHVSAKESGIAKSDYLKISCWAYCISKQPDYYNRAILVAEFKHHEKSLAWQKIRLVTHIGNEQHSFWHSGVPNQSKLVSFFVEPPYNFNAEEDEVTVFVWNPCDVPIVVDDILVEHWRKK